jgi:hypothetical protein
MAMAAPVRGRDVRLDVFRGLALLIIFITHVPGLVFAGFTPRAFGFADAAEAFVLLAGLAAYHAYSRPFLKAELTTGAIMRGSLPIFTRVWQLYVTHVALVVLVTGILAYAAQRFGDPEYLEASGLDVLLSQPAETVLGIMTLTFLPHFLDILPMYVILLAALPLAALALRVHWALPLLMSAALYGAVQVTGLNLPNMNASRVWFFNPVAWQFLFVLGFVVSHLAAAGRLDGLFARGALLKVVTVLALGYVAFTVLAAAPWRQFAAFANIEVLDPAYLPLADKTNLTPLRLFDALAKFWLIAVLVDRGAAWLDTGAGRMLALAGRHSLPVFVLGLVASTIATVLVKQAAYGLGVQFAVTLGGVALLIGFAALLDWQARTLKREAAARPAPEAPQGAAAPLMGKVMAQPSTK